MKQTFFLFALVASLALAGLANTPPPTPKPNKSRTVDTDLIIELDTRAKDATLYIPRDQIKQLRAELEQIDSGDSTAAVTTDGSVPGIFTRTQTFATGLLLSLAIVFGGVWFFRKKAAVPSGVKTAVIALAAAGLASTATFVYANVGPPLVARRISAALFNDAVRQYGRAVGKIKLAVETDYSIPRLVVPDPPAKEEGPKE